MSRQQQALVQASTPLRHRLLSLLVDLRDVATRASVPSTSQEDPRP